ncbi:MAG TPA: phosphocholine cytidylyltransferase family protein [Xanthomonadales bacterium]
MHAIILAAGRGNRLAEFNPDGRPKCLLEFGGRSLLARQLEILFRCGIQKATLVVGYEADLVIDHVATLDLRPEISFVYNPAFLKGSVLSLLAAHGVMTSGETVLVLDADVLFHPQIMQRLIESPHQNCFLIDQDFVAGDEPVKIAINHGEMVEFRKALPPGLQFDTLGESVGFFKFGDKMAAEISRTCENYQTEGLLDAPHEEALRDVLLATPAAFTCEDVSGLPWLEVDFPEDVERAIKQILPAIRKDLVNF